MMFILTSSSSCDDVAKQGTKKERAKKEALPPLPSRGLLLIGWGNGPTLNVWSPVLACM
jgi:hypothetical protein